MTSEERSLEPLAVLAEALAPAPAVSSPIHGPRHWRDVARVGALIRRDDPELNPRCLFLFAAFHDTQRLNDGFDPDHGSRAAEVLQSEVPHGLEAEELTILLHALRHHTDASTHTDPTIGACWDADRLTLDRVGITPDVSYISRSVVRQDFEGFRSRALRILASPDLTWDAIAATYEA